MKYCITHNLDIFFRQPDQVGLCDCCRQLDCGCRIILAMDKELIYPNITNESLEAYRITKTFQDVESEKQ